MGFLQPNLPVVDHATWHDLPRSERMRPMATHYATAGFGSPDVLIVFYALKIVVYVAVGWALVMTTPGIDGALDVGAWWDDPAVLFTFVFWTALFEVLGLGCGFGPLNLRFLPPMGAPLYWLRPGTIRLAPWPDRVPLTGGDRRTPVDVLLYAGLVVALAVTAWGAITTPQVVTVLALLVVLGLRDKVVFLAARSEVYAPLMVAALLGPVDAVVTAKILLVVI